MIFEDIGQKLLSNKMLYVSLENGEIKVWNMDKSFICMTEAYC